MIIPLQLTRAGQPIEAFMGAAFQFDFELIHASVPKFLSPGECVYLKSLRYPLRRDSYLLGRYAAKQALMACLEEEDASRIEIVKGVFEQPIIFAVSNKPTEFSLAHSFGAAVAVACRAGHPIGVDLEYIADRKADFLESCFTEREKSRLPELGQPVDAARYLCWTIKEALSKVLRCGLMVPCEVLEISHVEEKPQGTFVSHFTNFAQYKAHSWIADRYALSIVLPKNSAMEFVPDTLLLERFAKARVQMERENSARSLPKF